MSKFTTFLKSCSILGTLTFFLLNNTSNAASGNVLVNKDINIFDYTFSNNGVVPTDIYNHLKNQNDYDYDNSYIEATFQVNNNSSDIIIIRANGTDYAISNTQNTIRFPLKNHCNSNNTCNDKNITLPISFQSLFNYNSLLLNNTTFKVVLKKNYSDIDTSTSASQYTAENIEDYFGNIIWNHHWVDGFCNALYKYYYTKKCVQHIEGIDDKLVTGDTYWTVKRFYVYQCVKDGKHNEYNFEICSYTPSSNSTNNNSNSKSNNKKNTSNVSTNVVNSNTVNDASASSTESSYDTFDLNFNQVAPQDLKNLNNPGSIVDVVCLELQKLNSDTDSETLNNADTSNGLFIIKPNVKYKVKPRFVISGNNYNNSSNIPNWTDLRNVCNDTNKKDYTENANFIFHADGNHKFSKLLSLKTNIFTDNSPISSSTNNCRSNYNTADACFVNSEFSTEFNDLFTTNVCYYQDISSKNCLTETDKSFLNFEAGALIVQDYPIISFDNTGIYTISNLVNTEQGSDKNSNSYNVTVNATNNNNTIFFYSPIYTIIPDALEAKKGSVKLVDYLTAKAQLLARNFNVESLINNTITNNNYSVQTTSYNNSNNILNKTQNFFGVGLDSNKLVNEKYNYLCPAYYNQILLAMGEIIPVDNNRTETLGTRLPGFLKSTNIDYVAIHPFPNYLAANGKFLFNNNPISYNQAYKPLGSSNHKLLLQGYNRNTNSSGITKSNSALTFYSVFDVKDLTKYSVNGGYAPTDYYLGYYAEQNICVANNNTLNLNCTHKIQSTLNNDLGGNIDKIPQTTDSNFNMNYVVIDETNTTTHINSEYKIKDNIPNWHEHLGILPLVFNVTNNSNFLTEKNLTTVTFYNGRIRFPESSAISFNKNGENLQTSLLVNLEALMLETDGTSSTTHKIWKRIDDNCSLFNINPNLPEYNSNIKINNLSYQAKYKNSYEAGVITTFNPNITNDICLFLKPLDYSALENNCFNTIEKKLGIESYLNSLHGLYNLKFEAQKNNIDNYKTNAIVSFYKGYDDNKYSDYLNNIYCINKDTAICTQFDSNNILKTSTLLHLYDPNVDKTNVIFRYNFKNKRIINEEIY